MPQSPKHHESDKPKKPRNFFARREQLRLFMLVGMLMLVVILMGKAADPATWAWMWGGAVGVEGGGELTEAELADSEEIDTRLVPTTGDREEAIPGMVTTPRDVRPPEIKLDGEALAAATAEREAWEAQLESLVRHDRRLLPRVLRGVRNDTPLSEADQAKWEATLAQLNENWLAYTDAATKRVQDDDTLSDEDKASWLQIFHDMKKKWVGQLHDALAAAARPSTLTEEQEGVIAEFTAFYDVMSFNAITDNTILARPREIDAWFRMIELLQELPDEELQQEDVERVGFRQLYEQPREYRGKLVRVRGTVRRAGRVRAPANDLNIQEYFIFWLLPAGGPTSPIVIYSLDVPEGFPEINNEALEDEYFNIDESMEFTGYFYKRYAYPAAEGSLLAPVMLSRAPQWTPKVEEDMSLPDWQWIVLGVLGAGVLATGLAFMVYRLSSNVPKAEDLLPNMRAKPEPKFNVDDDELAPTASQHLANLEAGENTPTSDGEEERS